MEDKTTISRWQLATLTTGFLIGTSTLVVPTGPAQQDAWISVIFGGIFGILMMFLWFHLGSLFPEELPAQYFVTVAGRYLGTFLSLLYIWFSFHLAALVIRNVVETYMATVFVETPPEVIYAMSASLSIAALFAGLEPFARTTEIVIPFVIAALLLVTILAAATPDLVRPERLLPILERGIRPVLKGALANFAFPFGETIVLLSILPRVKRKREARKYVLYSFIVVTLALSVIQIRNITILGPAGMHSALFPTLTSVQMINVGQFLQRLDAIVLFSWTFGAFKKGTICLFAARDNLQVILGVKNGRLLIIPLCASAAALSYALYRTTPEMLDFAEYVYPIYAFPFEVILPSFVLLLATIRKKRR